MHHYAVGGNRDPSSVFVPRNLFVFFSMKFKFLPTIILTMVFRNTFAQDFSCPNHHYCDTIEIKYRAFSGLNDTYLNSSEHVIHRLPVKAQIDCKRQCVHTSGCQSSNHFQPMNSSVMMCELIAGNRWSNASSLIPRKNSTHFFIHVCFLKYLYVSEGRANLALFLQRHIRYPIESVVRSHARRFQDQGLIIF